MTERIEMREWPAQRLAGVRFQGELGEIPSHFQQLHELVAPSVVGQAIAFLHASLGDGRFDVEVGYPVAGGGSWPAGVRVWEWPGGAYLCLRHDGGWEGVVPELRRLYAFVQARNVGLSTGPTVQVWADGDPRDAAQAGVSWLGEPLLMPRWFGRLAAGLETELGPDAREQVLAGHEGLSPLSAPVDKSAWARGAMDRLDGLTGDERKRQTIMSGCSHVYPVARIAALRESYRQAGSLAPVLAQMRADHSLEQGLSYYAAPERIGQDIYVTKVPCQVQAWREATDPNEKRAAYCHCPMIRHAIRSGELLSDTYCYCSLGWFEQLWLGIIEQPVQVELLESILRGQDRCRVVIHLPEDVE